jgi:hypothetical protein
MRAWHLNINVQMNYWPALVHNLNGNPCSVKINGATKSIRSAKGETTKLL